MSGKKLCFVISHSHAGGGEKVWLDLADGLAARGHAITLVAFYPAGTVTTAVEQRWTHLLDSKPGGPLSILSLVGKLTSFLRRSEFDFVLTALPAANAIAPLAVRLAGARAKVIRSHHSPVSTHSRLLDALDGVTGGFGCVRATVSVSRTVEESLARKSRRYRQRSVVIQNALPPAIEGELDGLASRYDRTAPRGRTVVATGRLAAQKNYPVLLRAAALMRQVRIRIVGSGPDEGMLGGQVGDLEVGDRVEFLGARSRSETLGILAEGDVFAQPSLFEGHSLALIEAGKLGLPLVVSNVPVQLEAITAADGEVCGIAVDPHDDTALAAAITRLLDEPETYRHYSEAARRLVKDVTFAGMVVAYERLLAD